MFGWIETTFEAVKLGLEWLVGKQKTDERNEYREDGARGQKLTDDEKALAVKDSQLVTAAKPDEKRGALLKKAKGRKRQT